MGLAHIAAADNADTDGAHGEDFRKSIETACKKVNVNPGRGSTANRPIQKARVMHHRQAVPIPSVSVR
jgi:hypothetical protein